MTIIDNSPAERRQIAADHRVGTFVERGAVVFVVVNDEPYRIVRSDDLPGPGEAVLYIERPIPPSAVVYIVDPATGRVTGIQSNEDR